MNSDNTAAFSDFYWKMIITEYGVHVVGRSATSATTSAAATSAAATSATKTSCPPGLRQQDDFIFER
jgi:hypothetical protein